MSRNLFKIIYKASEKLTPPTHWTKHPQSKGTDKGEEGLRAYYQQNKIKYRGKPNIKRNISPMMKRKCKPRENLIETHSSG